MEQDTVLIFQQPELYFFPFYKDIVFSPFGIPEKSFRYLIYKLLYILKIPICSVFWGDWKKKIPTARRVIIFDYGYQSGMEKYIKKKNPSCEVSLFFWNIISKGRRNHRLFSDKGRIYSTDLNDCKTYHFKYNHMFYPKEYYQPYVDGVSRRLFFLGVDKGRASKLYFLKNRMELCGVECDIRIIKDRSSKNDKKVNELYTKKRLSYDAYLKEIMGAGILLDINQKGQTALTMRVVESIFFSKKLITNNQEIRSYEFYQPNNILILPKQLKKIKKKEIMDFLNAPYCPYSEEVREHFSFEHWINNF